MSTKKSRNTPRKRITEFQCKYIYEKNNELWCRPCNVKLDFDKKSSVAQHLETKTHVNLCSIVNSNKKTRFKNNDRNEIRNEFARDLMVAFASANIPAHKLENKVLRKTISKYLNDDVANAWPSTSTVREQLQSVYRSEFEQLKTLFIDKKVAIFADETTDSEQRYVLNILNLILLKEVNHYWPRRIFWR